MSDLLNRRSFLRRAALSGSVAFGSNDLFGKPFDRSLPVAGVVTVYKRNSHADVLLGKILAGYDQQGGPGPKLKLASLYIDQPASSKLGLELAKRFNVPVFKSIDGAVTVGSDSIPVGGVISIGEHGDYPDHSRTGQKMYPRRRFLDEIAATGRKHGRSIPVFNDKHLSWNWRDARHMYDVTRRLKMPFMAGSSIPVAWRAPALTLPRGCKIKEAIAIGYGGSEAYGFHALEGLQCMVERRSGGESGVRSIQAVTGDSIWQAERDGWWSRELLDAAVQVQPNARPGEYRKLLKPDSPFYLIEYRDGLRATLAMMNGICREFSFAATTDAHPKPQATWIRLDYKKPFGHFAWLLQGIEHLIHHRRAPYPVERTLLTTGILDRAMHSIAAGGRKFDTPELAIAYRPADWGYADRKFPGVAKR
jgi:hypothetical protein